jgi:hypothetical protein
MPLNIFGVTLDIHTMLYAAAMVIVGYQAVLFAIFTKRFAIQEGLLPRDPKMDRAFGWITLESGLMIGVIAVLLGLVGTLAAIYQWAQTGFGPLDPRQTMRLVIGSVLALALGIQTCFASFFVSILSLRRRKVPHE